MISKLFTIYDCKAEAYLKPFMYQNKGEAIRAFSDTVNSNDSMLNKHPEDYTLFELGTWDDNTAKYDIYFTPVSLGKALEYLKGNAIVSMPAVNS